MNEHRAEYAEFVDAELKVTYQRIHEAVDLIAKPTTRGDEARWLEQAAERDAVVSAAAPRSWPLTRLGLSASETRVLWVLIAHELSPTARTQLRTLGTEQEIDVTIDVLRQVVFGAVPHPRVWRELATTSRLRQLCLVEPVSSGLVPSHRVALRVAPRVLALVHGELAVDSELAKLIVARTQPEVGLDDLVVNELARARVCASMERTEGFTIVSGLNGTGRRSLLSAAAADRGRAMLEIDARRLSSELDVAERQARVLERECQLLERVPLILHLDSLQASGEIPDRIGVLEAVLSGPVFATSSRVVARRWRAPALAIELTPLTGHQRSRLWQQALPDASTGDADLLSNMYPLAPALIAAVGTSAVAEAGGTPLRPSHVAAGIRNVLDDRMAGLAKRLSIRQTWDDLVLPEDQTMAVVELLARIRSRRQVYEDWGFEEKLGKGLGVAALFTGPPGTGKTMCAGLIAKDLGTEIYQVDLSRIVSKWIGETEKNLATLFDAAEAGHAVLLFDEADSLFGKRTKVSSSNDRHANQETNYLLQRIESFAGICILTTNHEPSIDEAFLRRLSVKITFQLPDEAERERLWAAMLPSAAPVESDLELATLAKKFTMGGGNIRNAVLRAAFLAADAGEPIGIYHLRQAAQLEYEAMGKLS